MNAGHSKHIINCFRYTTWIQNSLWENLIQNSVHSFSSQLSNLRNACLKQPRKILQNPISRYSNGSNRTTFKVKSTPVIENATNGELPSRISNLWKPIGFTVTVRVAPLNRLFTIRLYNIDSDHSSQQEHSPVYRYGNMRIFILHTNSIRNGWKVNLFNKRMM